MKYTHQCRECDATWDMEYPMDESAPTTACPNCGSEDTYRQIGSTGFILRNGGIGWAGKGTGFHPRGELHVDLGGFTPADKKFAKEHVRALKADGEKFRKENPDWAKGEGRE